MGGRQGRSQAGAAEAPPVTADVDGTRAVPSGQRARPACASAVEGRTAKRNPCTAPLPVIPHRRVYSDSALEPARRVVGLVDTGGGPALECRYVN
ncbi:hypothetical protein X947_3802 [Burkholderia pseudomallei MSHR7334]|nr:hypothetical protein X947_3802 [Burkholderia pseudomallei MSHR7334]